MNTTATKPMIAFVVPTHMPGMGGWGNGYVAIPEGHPCYRMDYDAIHDIYEIEVNGGLTFSDWANEKNPAEVQGMWVVGFDTLHAGDTMAKWPNEKSVMAEAERLKTQLSNLVLSERGKEKKLHDAAPDLLEACIEFCRKVEAGEAKSNASYKQMKAAIKKAIGE